MNLEIGDQLILRKGKPGEQIGQIFKIIDPDKFYNESGELQYMIRTMKDGDVIYKKSKIQESDNIEFYKAKEDREFDVMKEFKSIL